MRLVADSGLWTTGPVTVATPLVAVLEVSGAVLSWVIDAAPEDTSPHITFTDVARAEWLWRVLGESGHVALASAVESAPTAGAASSVELADVDIVPGSLDPLRRLAVGHWLRRWWPASRQDGIAGLDRALLDVEVALLTAGAQGYFFDDTLDSDVVELLAPHAPALGMHARDGDPRILDLVRAGAGLADEVGIDGVGWPELHAYLDDSREVSRTAVTTPSGRRDDYALAAGADAAPPDAVRIARGVTSINWTAVPPGIFDAAEDTVEWTVEVAGTSVVARVRADLIGPGPATGVEVRLRSGAIGGSGALDADGRATLPLVADRRGPLTESAAWVHDWSATSVIVGAEGGTETRAARERARRWARGRLDRPPNDAFLAEILAAESEY
ncbi:hypothetical protein [Mycobacterium sp.]|uniref:hypothetical protein n=1 Tax=Mycobacterium sp. TaxID=1785 RepID=UPI0025CC0BAC|nr:hypothetical protein [Mycobacterium sp.]MBW0012419.1 hypothetical protein [Mycobacterium sp.]